MRSDTAAESGRTAIPLNERNTGTAGDAQPAPSRPLSSAATARSAVPAAPDDPIRQGQRPEAKQVLDALRRAYPDRVEEVARRNGDWAVRVAGEWFSWAEGRLLPEAERERWERYDPIPFYVYPKELPPIPDYTEEEKARLIEAIRRRETDPPRRHNGFFETLWRAWDRESSWDRIKTTWFLGLKTTIHRELLEDLAAVEEEIFAAMRDDPELEAFVESLGQVAGYSWRPIAGTSSMSFHSYGTAVDIIPRYYERKQPYWRWAMDLQDDWFTLPYERRFMPPASFVRAFEKHGFIWGGKWLFFDTIHFEYRPEVFLLSGEKVERRE